MKKLAAVLLVSLLFCGCPYTGGQADPYLTARTIINQAGLTLPVAEGIFRQWALSQPKDRAAKVKKARLTFAIIKTSVSNGLKLAHTSVDIAEQAETEPDMAQILAHTDVVWKDLRRFLASLLSSGNHVTIYVSPGEGADAGTEMFDDVAVKVSSMMYGVGAIDALPESIIPE